MTPIARRSLAQKSAVGEEEAKISSVASRPEAASIALDLDLDQVALRSSLGIGQCPDEAEAPVLALRDRQGPFTSAIRRWPNWRRCSPASRPPRTSSTTTEETWPAERRWSSSTSAMPRSDSHSR